MLMVGFGGTSVVDTLGRLERLALGITPTVFSGSLEGVGVVIDVMTFSSEVNTTWCISMSEGM